MYSSPVLVAPNKILVAGDTHANIEHWRYIIEVALDHDCDLIFQVGDLSYFPHTAEGIKFLAFLSRSLVEHNVPCVFVGGNHENYDALYGGEWPICTYGFWRLMPNLYYVPRGLRWNWQGIKIMGLGGAASVDRAERLRWESRAHAPRTLWWPEEEISWLDVRRALAVPGEVDIMFTHDVPLAVDIPLPAGSTRFADMIGVGSREGLQEVVDAVKPKLLLHGHMHFRYTTKLVTYEYATDVIGLGKDEQQERSWFVLDLKDFNDKY